ncbi:MAG: hypothetical protein ACTHV2_13955 [Brachybacterium sp.]|uniref:hypothetical protein n=1 Tax=Brachybacterium sp. TaxID=1891286 RepID=UPI00264B194F|nr:hypothetical protein [Brachybacterium sp.]MDN6302697.1 hypothetical protein [Brachybacterium sp.]MDN6327811.1 hypothetical protein [Brachybacterium sp.]
MTEPETTPRRGRRARALSPEEQAALEARAAMETTGEQSAVPGVRGAVAPPTADAPVPTLRKFGRRARIIELSEQPTTEPAAAGAGRTGAEEPSAEDASVATIARDHDGVELGELSVTEAPEPRPAPRFDGKVLHRPENSGSRLLPWLVWILIAIALVVLVVLLLTGVLGSDTTAAALPTASLPDLSLDHPVLEEPAA